MEERNGTKEDKERKERIGLNRKSYPRDKEKGMRVPCLRDDGPIPP